MNNYHNRNIKLIDYISLLAIVFANYIIYPKFFYLNNSFIIFITNYFSIAFCLFVVILYNKKIIYYCKNPIAIFIFLYTFFIFVGEPFVLGKIRGVLLTIICIFLLINIDRDHNYEKILKYSSIMIAITGVASRYSDYGLDAVNGGVLSSEFKINAASMVVCYLCFSFLQKKYTLSFLLLIITLWFATRTSLLALLYFFTLFFLNIRSRNIKILNLSIILIFAFYPWYLNDLPPDLIKRIGNFSTLRTYFQQLLAMTSDFSLFRFETSYSYKLLSEGLLDKDLIYSAFGDNFLYDLKYSGQCPHNCIFENSLDYGILAIFLYLILFLRRENRYQSICVGMYLLASGFQCEAETAPFVIPFFLFYILLGRLSSMEKLSQQD